MISTRFTEWVNCIVAAADGKLPEIAGLRVFVDPLAGLPTGLTTLCFQVWFADTTRRVALSLSDDIEYTATLKDVIAGRLVQSLVDEMNSGTRRIRLEVD